MQNIIFIIVGFIQLGIAIYGTMQVRRHFNWYALLVLIVVYGLAYDNFVIGMVFHPVQNEVCPDKTGSTGDQKSLRS